MATNKASDETLKYDKPETVESLVWDMRLADLPRGEQRTILNRTYNGDPPFDKRTAEENNVEVNRNFLEGTGMLTDARTQWNSNFLKPGDLVTVRVDCKDTVKRQEYSSAITKHFNRGLKNDLGMITQSRETGAGTLLHGVGATNWQDRRSPIPKTVPMSSLMIPSETDIDFDNLEYFSIFREMTPGQLHEKIHGPKTDPGWNLDLAESELKFVAEQIQKQPNATAFQYMPERIAELKKQDLGFWGSDAVPTIDYWDFYFRERENGEGWYRRIFLDWNSSGRSNEISARYAPKSPNAGKWLYSSGRRFYAKSWREIIHCNFGDCSCVTPLKYHSVRSLGWMIWGIVDIQNRLRCKITEQAFSDLMWFFRTASQNDFARLKKANFLQMGIIPQGLSWVMPNERYSPAPQFIELVLQQNQQLLNQHSASYTRSGERTPNEKDKTATQVIAEVNSINALVSGVMNMSYTYEKFKYVESARRHCIPNNPYRLAKQFRKSCLDDGVPPEYLNAERWEIEPERAMGAGNKTVQMAIVQYLNSIRQNLGPDAQRKVDHIGIQIMTEDAQAAEDLAPIRGQQPISKSAHDAELSTDRLMRGLPFTPTPQMVYEDYVGVWLRDMGLIIQQIQQGGNVGTPEQLAGLQNIAQHVGMFLQIMGQSDDAKEKVRMYQTALGQLMNVVKGFAQRLQEQMKKQNGAGNGGLDPESMVKLRGKMMIDQAKAQNMRESHAARTAQKQVSFEMSEAQKERKAKADLRREQAKQGIQMMGEMARNRMKSVQE